MHKVAALYIDPRGPYPRMPEVDCWDEARDARTYAGPLPVVAHPPCARWSRLAESVAARFPGDPRYAVGADAGCFASALAAVRAFGGVLEHPAQTKAWAAHGLTRPVPGRWTLSSSEPRLWVCEVWQSAYGHLCPKATWLAYCGHAPPIECDWRRPPGTHGVGEDSKRRRARGCGRPRASRFLARATPLEFAKFLVELASGAMSRGKSNRNPTVQNSQPPDQKAGKSS